MRIILTTLLTVGMAIAGTITTTTPLHNLGDGSTTCTQGTNLTSCDFTNWWSYASQTTNQSTDFGSFDGTSWVMSSASTYTSYNWGTAQGSYWFSQHSGGGFGSSDSYSITLGSWNGNTLDTNGYMNVWNGNDNQLNHNTYSYFYTWSCEGDICTQDFAWIQGNTFEYSAGGGYYTTLFGEYYSSDTWSQIPDGTSEVTSGSHRTTWNRNTSATETPEPSTYATMAFAGLVCAAKLRRKKQ